MLFVCCLFWGVGVFFNINIIYFNIMWNKIYTRGMRQRGTLRPLHKLAFMGQNVDVQIGMRIYLLSQDMSTPVPEVSNY